jgi:hypothetical protein
MAYKVQYGLILKKKDRILGIEKTHNGDDRQHGGEYTYRLDEWSEDKWFVNTYEEALMAKWVSEEWYNSSHEEPVNPYHPQELEVIKVATIIVNQEEDVEEELTIVNEKLKQLGYATLDVEKYKKDSK